jgi:hypothetical protein
VEPVVSRVIDAPVGAVWAAFVDPARWPTQVRLTVLEPGRRCLVSLAGTDTSHQREYDFTPVDLGEHRGGTVVTVVDEPAAGLAGRLLDLVAGGFAARTVEGAVRADLAALAAECTTRVFTRAA